MTLNHYSLPCRLLRLKELAAALYLCYATHWGINKGYSHLLNVRLHGGGIVWTYYLSSLPWFGMVSVCLTQVGTHC